MSSQLLHDLADDLENMWNEVKGFRSSFDSKFGVALGTLRSHAESDGSQLFADAKTVAGQIEHDVAADAAPLVTDVESGVRDLVQTAEQVAAPAAEPAPQAPAEPAPSDPQPAA